ncbi:MAG: lytic transglycosylase domain-containing protein [Blastocatellia bacterium]|nr:lytic transglycosylase domain-containing protein [Blastocatellia bacterium]
MARSIRRQLFFFVLLTIVLSGSYFGYTYWRIHRYDDLIARVAKTYRLDAKLVRSVVYEESYFDPSAKSRVGALGLMQITPVVVTEWEQTSGDTAEPRKFVQYWVKKYPHVAPNKNNPSSGELLTNPEINLHIGCWYLDHLRQRFTDETQKLPMMLAGYNAGPSQAERWRDVVRSKSTLTEDEYIQRIDYPETQNYVRRIMTRYRKKNTVFDF